MNEKEMNKVQELTNRIRTLEGMLSDIVYSVENESDKDDFEEQMNKVQVQYRGYLRENGKAMTRFLGRYMLNDGIG